MGKYWCEIHGHYHGPPYCSGQQRNIIHEMTTKPPKFWFQGVDYSGYFDIEFSMQPDIPDRPPLEEIYLRMAEELAKRSTCSRLQVGCVLTDTEMKSVLSVGYNGNCHGFPNKCDSEEPGACGCVHSESNALVKAPGSVDKIAFITDSPCTMCGKLLVQSNVKKVYYRRKYRLPAGLDVLERAGIPAHHYTEYENRWRD